MPDGASVVVTPSFGYDTASNEELFGSTPVDVKQSTFQYALRASYRRKVAASTTLSFGIDMQAQSSTLDRNGSLTLPAREGDIFVFGQPPRNDIASDHWNVLVIDTAPFVERRDRPSAASPLVPGLRFEPVLIEGSPVAAGRRRHAAQRLRQLLAAGKPRRRAPQRPIYPRHQGAALPAEPAHRRRVPRHQEADPDGRRRASTASRPIRRT